MALCSARILNERQKLCLASQNLMESRGFPLPSSSCPLTPLPSSAAGSFSLSTTHRSEAGGAASTEEQHFSPACPLHGIFLSEADVRKEGKAAAVHSRKSSKQPYGGSRSLKPGLARGSGNGQPSSSDVRESKNNGESSNSSNRHADAGGKCSSEGLARGRSGASSRDDIDTTKTTAENDNWTKEGIGVNSGGAFDDEWSNAGEKARFLVIFRNCVYNLTGFHHPGGEELLENRYGTDITEAFEEAGHSAAAYKIVDDYFVGIVAERRQAYIEQVGGRICLCRGDTFVDGNKTCFLAKTSKDTAAEEKEEKLKPRDFSKQQQRARRRSMTAQDYDALQAGTPKLIPTGPDGYPLHPLIDFHRPLLPQIWALNQENYAEFVNSHSFTTKVVPLMPYAWMEPFSKTHWWVIPLVWMPWTIYFVHISCSKYCASAVLAMMLAGLGAWTVVEYVLHRFVFHFPEAWLPDLRGVRLMHFLLHAVHHVLPLDPLRLVVPPVLLVFLSVWVYGAVSLILPQWFVCGAWPGGLLGYMVYDMVHYSAHHSSIFCRLAHVRQMKVYHMQHHFKHPMLGFGVSNTFWDRVFGTAPPPTAS